jgi:L-asparagine transporter-like permease
MLYSLAMAIEHFKEYLRTKRKRDLIIFVSTILILLIIILIPFDTKRYELYLSLICLICGLFLYTLSFMDIESIKERGEDSDTLLYKAEKEFTNFIIITNILFPLMVIDYIISGKFFSYHLLVFLVAISLFYIISKFKKRKNK